MTLIIPAAAQAGMMGRCTVFDRDLGKRPAVIKQVFSAFPAEASAGPGQFRGQAAMGEHSARWDLAITGGQPPLRPLRPPVLYRAPLPRTKLEAVVPDGQVTGMLQVDDRTVSVSGWRGTAGHRDGRAQPQRRADRARRAGPAIQG